MEKTQKNKLPRFFYDSTEKDCNCEPLIDFWLSWTLRCAESKYAEVNNKVHEYSKKMLLYLIFGENDSNEEFTSNYMDYIDKNIESVEVWKQEGRIDLWIHVAFNDGEKHALVIENKYYTHLKEGQLERYKAIAQQYFDAHPQFKVKYFYLTAHEKTPANDVVLCEKNGFCHAPIGNLKEIIGDEPTGNDLFDEFWFNWY